MFGDVVTLTLPKPNLIPSIVAPSVFDSLIYSGVLYTKKRTQIKSENKRKKILNPKPLCSSYEQKNVTCTHDLSQSTHRTRGDGGETASEGAKAGWTEEDRGVER